MAERPLPVVDDPLAAPFWDGIRAGRIRFQQCEMCGYLRWPVAPFCPECLDEAYAWAEVSGEGSIWSLAVYDHLYHQAFAADVPYVVALVELDAGPRLVANVIDTSPEEVHVGDRVSAAFQPVTDRVTLLQFRVADTATT